MRFRSPKHVRWYVGSVLVLLLLFYVGALRPIERATRGLVDPVVNFFYNKTQTIRQSYSDWRSEITARSILPTLLRERDELKTRVALVEAENATLRKELKYPDRTKWQTVGADVIAKTTDIGGQTIIINRGSSDGLVENQVVFAEQGIYVGVIASVLDRRATVRLLNDRQSRVGALLAKSGKAVGIVEGGYGLGVRLTLIPPQEVITPDDLLVTNDVSDFMPRGLLIGRVISVAREIYEPFQHALVEPAISDAEIKTVSVIIKK